MPLPRVYLELGIFFSVCKKRKKLHKAEVYLSHYSKRFIDVLSRVNDVLKLEESLSRLIGDGLIIKSSCVDRAVY